MKPIFTLLILLGTFSIQAQDTLTSADFPNKGDMFPVGYANLDESNMPWLLFYTGVTNFNLDISDIVPQGKGFDEMKDPKDVDGGDQVPKAEYGFEYNYGNVFFANSGNYVNMVGITPNIDFQIPLTFAFDSAVTFIKAPLTFGDKVVDSSTSVLQIPFLLDIKAKMISKYEVNGYGTLTVPGDTTFDVIRLRRVLTFSAIANQLLTQQIDTIYDSLVTWEFYTKGYRNSVLRAEVNVVATDTTIDTFALFTFFDKKPVGITEPITSSFNVNISLENSQLYAQSELPAACRVYNLNGALVAENKLEQKMHSIPMQHLPKGTYVVVLNKSHNVSSQLIVKP